MCAEQLWDTHQNPRPRKPQRLGTSNPAARLTNRQGTGTGASGDRHPRERLDRGQTPARPGVDNLDSPRAARATVDRGDNRGHTPKPATGKAAASGDRQSIRPNDHSPGDRHRRVRGQPPSDPRNRGTNNPATRATGDTTGPAQPGTHPRERRYRGQTPTRPARLGTGTRASSETGTALRATRATGDRQLSDPRNRGQTTK